MSPNNSFIQVVNNDGELIYSTLSSKSPSLVSMRLDHRHEVAYIEFTAKILGDRYPELISGKTILDAIRGVERRCSCFLRIDSIINDARVLLTDITKDISISMSNELKQALFMSVSNTKKWRVEIRKQNGIDVKKSVRSNSKCRERISFYCKTTELNLSRNRAFIDTLTNPEKIVKYFHGKTRVEYNLSSSHMIKKMLKIEDTYLHSVLNSNANPILDVFNRMFDLDTSPKGNDFTDYRRFETLNDYLKNLLLKEFDNDVMKAEQVYRHFHSPRSNFRTKRKELVRIRNIRQTSQRNERIEFNEIVEKLKQ